MKSRKKRKLLIKRNINKVKKMLKKLDKCMARNIERNCSKYRMENNEK